jgi:hypothetical protein
MAFYIYNVWLLTHTEFQALTHYVYGNSPISIAKINIPLMVGVIAFKSLPTTIASRFSFAYRTGHEAPCPIKGIKFLKFLFIKEQYFISNR